MSRAWVFPMPSGGGWAWLLSSLSQLWPLWPGFLSLQEAPLHPQLHPHASVCVLHPACPVHLHQGCCALLRRWCPLWCPHGNMPLPQGVASPACLPQPDFGEGGSPVSFPRVPARAVFNAYGKEASAGPAPGGSGRVPCPHMHCLDHIWDQLVGKPVRGCHSIPSVQEWIGHSEI